MFGRIIRATVRKIGAKKLLFLVLEQAVRATKSKKDDKMLEDVKKFLENYGKK
tara:strand:+ start:797 stop:955 length:159 start_codon:yes stop_codon:yes gene_type:complete